LASLILVSVPLFIAMRFAKFVFSSLSCCK
jgi:hypothetical protein